MPSIATLAPLALIRLDTPTLRAMVPAGEALPKWAEKFIEAHNRNVDAMNAVTLNAGGLTSNVNSIIQDITVLQSAPSTVDSLQVDWGTFGRYSQDGRIWGLQTQTTSNSNAFSILGMLEAAQVTGSGAEVPSAAQPRAWIFDAAGLTINDVAGFRQASVGIAAWIQRPRLLALFQVSDRADNVLTNRRVVVGFTSSNAIALASADATLRYVTLRYDSAVGPNWYISTANGSTASAVDTGIRVVIGTDYSVDLDCSVAGVVKVTINGVSFLKTTDLPSGVALMKWGATITRLLADNLACELRLHHAMVSRR